MVSTASAMFVGVTLLPMTYMAPTIASAVLVGAMPALAMWVMGNVPGLLLTQLPLGRSLQRRM